MKDVQISGSAGGNSMQAEDANQETFSMRIPFQPNLEKPLLSIAPMMEWTDVHYRQMARLLSKHTWLWTEMVVDKTINNVNPKLLDKYLWFPEEQHPIVLQVGGSQPEELARAIKLVVPYGYDEINLNCGCPSDRVAGAGSFGASLMLEPDNVAACMRAMAAAIEDTRTAMAAAHVASPDTCPPPPPAPQLSVKCRLGADDCDSYGELVHFIRTVSEGCFSVRRFVIHARSCLLGGLLTPTQNRSIPPLRREWAWALKREFPHLELSVNGGFKDLEEVKAALATGHQDFPLPTHIPRVLEGVMVGRAAYITPWPMLGCADSFLFGAASDPCASRRQLLRDYAAFADGIKGRWSRALATAEEEPKDEGGKEDGGKGNGEEGGKEDGKEGGKENGEKEGKMEGKMKGKMEGKMEEKMKGKTENKYQKKHEHGREPSAMRCDPGLRVLIAPLANVFTGTRNVKKWRNELDEICRKSPETSVSEALNQSLYLIPEEDLDAPPSVFNLSTLTKPIKQTAPLNDPTLVQAPPSSVLCEECCDFGSNEKLSVGKAVAGCRSDEKIEINEKKDEEEEEKNIKISSERKKNEIIVIMEKVSKILLLPLPALPNSDSRAGVNQEVRKGLNSRKTSSMKPQGVV
eukprot:CAMPEP_0175050540 /NCGR_PEP_ID=MMETSP0052_2-20121109/7314_1 /TAXON_ID=51329 ORGANISM="Polytomella parva, Strain SAG 63-3" /NCGR_SAMPLE_ID=MMETSP0052_2 /ASSEMBLY_ACC=CAM_ASM_000194 /LENGTH=632 /DNA_ID=CAMNT_0016314751 /DNA_START=172 /DNA_END=2070 /DNA_ORIENTATION=-